MVGIENPFDRAFETRDLQLYDCEDHAHLDSRPKDPVWKMVTESVKTMSKLQASYETVKNRCVSNMVEGKLSPKHNDTDSFGIKLF